MRDVVIVSACRTAIGTFGGALKDLHVVNLATAVMKEAVKRAGIDPSIIDDVRFGNMYEHYTSMNLARVASIQAGHPIYDQCRHHQQGMRLGHGGRRLGNGHDPGRLGRCHPCRRGRAYVRRSLCSAGGPVGVPSPEQHAR